MKANIQLLGKYCLLGVVATLVVGNATVVAAQDQTWSYTYNSLGLKETEDGPRTDVSDITTYTYDAAGNVATVTNALGHTMVYNEYDAAGRVLSVTDENGVTTLFEYHPRGWLTKSTLVSPLGVDLVTQYTYYADGELQQMVAPTGSVITFEYNGANHLTAMANDLGERIEYTLDAAGNRTSEVIKSASGVIVYRLQTAYDELSRVMEVIGNHGQQDSIDYDANDNPVVLSNARSAQTQQQYDALNRVRKIIDPHLEETAFTYDAQDRIRTVTDARGNTTTYTYDGLGNLLSLDSPDTGLTTYLYDAAGNRTRQTDSRGVVVNFTYDALNRLTSVSYPGAPAENVTYQYDSTANGNHGVGRLTGISAGSSTIAYTYNALGLISRKAVTAGTSTSVIQYLYNAQGLLTTLVYPSGREVVYTYDAQGRVATIATRATASDTLQTLVDDVAYLPFGPARAYTYGNGLSHEYAYDLDYRVEAIQVGGINPLLSRNYFYDVTNNITGLVDGVDGSKTQNFDYDLLDRLVSAEGGYGQLDYLYDAVGNRLSETRNGTTDAYTYENESNRLEGITATSGNRTFTYDATGNRITQNGNTTYTYNHANRLIRVSVNGVITQYSYNPLGQRVQKTLANGQQEHYHYDESGQLLAVHDATGTVQREYVYWGSQQIALVTRPSNSSSSSSSSGGSSGATPGTTPAKVEAENFSAYYDTTAGNLGDAACTFGDMDAQISTDTGGGCHLAYTTSGEWTEYPITVSATGTYNVTFRAATNTTSRLLRLQVDGVTAADNIPVPRTNWTTFGSYTVPVALTAGSHTLRVVFVNGYVNLNYLSFAPAAGSSSSSSTSSSSGSASSSGLSVYYIHSDHLNTAQVITDAAQQVVWMANYEPFGKIAQGQNNSIEHFSRFPGQYIDFETGLYYNYFRDYDPSIGRYIQSDPIGLEGGINTYAYVGGNPMKFSDPTGQFSLTEVGVGAGFGAGFLAWYCAVNPSAAMCKNIGNLLEKCLDKVDSKDDTPCPPCMTVSGKIVRVGTIAYRPLDVIPDDRMEHGVYGSHHNIFIAKQAPRGTPQPCRCQWVKQKYVLKPHQITADMIPIEEFIY